MDFFKFNFAEIFLQLGTLLKLQKLSQVFPYLLLVPTIVVSVHKFHLLGFCINHCCSRERKYFNEIGESTLDVHWNLLKFIAIYCGICGKSADSGTILFPPLLIKLKFGQILEQLEWFLDWFVGFWWCDVILERFKYFLKFIGFDKDERLEWETNQQKTYFPHNSSEPKKNHN